MRVLLIVAIVGLTLSCKVASALTVDEVIRLKQAGVSDSTIEMLIKGDGDNRSAGTWKTKDGWIVHTTETREPSVVLSDERYQYPIVVYPSYSRSSFRRR
jgi:hypothetical protein